MLAKNYMQDPRSKNVFPDGDNIKDFAMGYLAMVSKGFEAIDKDQLERTLKAITYVAEKGGHIWAAGNGGSSSICDHLCCDWMKGTRHPSHSRLKVHSLTANQALFSAIANDMGYENTFTAQMDMLAEKGDLLILVSSSGNSQNVINAAQIAASKGIEVVGVTGFSGGKLKELATYSIHVPMDNYGVVEDAHQMFMHVIAQFIDRQRRIK